MRGKLEVKAQEDSLCTALLDRINLSSRFPPRNNASGGALCVGLKLITFR